MVTILPNVSESCKSIHNIFILSLLNCSSLDFTLHILLIIFVETPSVVSAFSSHGCPKGATFDMRSKRIFIQLLIVLLILSTSSGKTRSLSDVEMRVCTSMKQWDFSIASSKSGVFLSFFSLMAVGMDSVKHKEPKALISANADAACV